MARKFDNKFLQKTIDYHYKMLSSGNLNNLQKQVIKSNIIKFSQYLNIENKKYEEDCNGEVELSKGYIVMIKKLLTKAKNDYRFLDKEVMKLIIYLNDNYKYEKIVVENDLDAFTEEEIINLSLDIYKEYFPNVYDKAISIIDNPIGLIHFNEEEVIGSECFFSETFKLPFIYVEEANKIPSAFIHELQHGIEEGRRYKPDEYYSETCPILFETLFIDKINKCLDNQALSLYVERIEEIMEIIDKLGNYFKVLVELKKYQFALEDKEVLKILCKHNLLFESELDLNEVLSIDIDTLLTYTLSYLKSIELRERLYYEKKDGLRHIRRVMMGREMINSKDCLSVLTNLKKYLEEVNKKNHNLVLKR